MVQGISLYVMGEWSFYGIFRCPYAVPYIGCGNCAVIQCPGRSLWMWSWLAILASALLMGRVFCGWACPGGLVAEIFAAFSFLRNKIKGAFDTIASYGKYILLCASLYVFFAMNNPRWAIPIRTGEFFKSVGLTFQHADNLWLVRTAFVLGAFALGIVIPRFWCRFLCPTGGALELFSRFSLFRYGMTGKCTDCNRCSRACDLETKPSRINCTNCGDCTSVCKPGAIELKGLFPMAYVFEKK